MTTLSTVIKLANYANNGISFQDKKRAFLIAGLGIIGHHRKKVRTWFRNQIDASGSDTFINMSISMPATKKTIHFVMRRGNEGDYLMGGEMVRGGYEMPDFEPDIIIDGGANIGMFFIQAASQFPDAKIVCYEPDAGNCQMLRKNIALNKLDGETHELGLWSKDTTLYYHSQSAETGFIDENPPGVSIRCTLPEIKANCWLKLDVEGAEYEILPALFAASRYPRWISMEVHYFNTQGDKIMDLLRENNYVVKGGADKTANCTIISAARLESQS